MRLLLNRPHPLPSPHRGSDSTGLQLLEGSQHYKKVLGQTAVRTRSGRHDHCLKTFILQVKPKLEPGFRVSGLTVLAMIKPQSRHLATVKKSRA